MGSRYALQNMIEKVILFAKRVALSSVFILVGALPA